MVQIQCDVVCSKCGSVNEHELIGKKEPNVLKTYTKCKKCGHRSLKSTLTYTVSQPIYEIFIPSPNTSEIY